MVVSPPLFTCLSSSGLGCLSEDVPFGAVTLVPGPPFPLLGQWGLSPPLLVAKFILSLSYSGLPLPAPPLLFHWLRTRWWRGLHGQEGAGTCLWSVQSSSLVTWRQRLDYVWSAEEPGAPGDSGMVRSPRTPSMQELGGTVVKNLQPGWNIWCESG